MNLYINEVTSNFSSIKESKLRFSTTTSLKAMVISLETQSDHEFIKSLLKYLNNRHTEISICYL